MGERALMNPLSFNSVLITGATGFVGRRIARELYLRGKKLKCLVRKTSHLDVLKDIDAEFVYGDITHPSSLEEAVKGVDAIIHLVAVILEKGKATFGRINYEGTKNLLEATKRGGIKRFIYMSNIGSSQNPSLPFLYSKWCAEEEIRKSGLDWTIFRSSIMFGVGDGFITPLARIVRLSPIVPIIGKGRTKFQPISVEDVAKCVALALDDERTIGRIIFLGGGEQLSYKEIVELVIRTLGVKRVKVPLPVPLIAPFAWLMEKFLPRPILTYQQLKMLSIDNITELDVVEREFGFKPLSLREGISYIKQAPKSGQFAQR